MTTQTMTPASRLGSTATSQVSSFSHTLASEWHKLATLRSTYITLALGLVISIAATALASIAMGATQDEWPAGIEPITFSMVGNIFALIIFSVFGVMVMTNEYANGMVRLTLTATPKRGRVFLAKILLVGLITLAFGTMTTVGMFLVAQAVLGANGMPVTDLGNADARRMVLGLGVTMLFFPILGLAFGVLLRSTAGAITTVLGLLWLPLALGEFLPMWWRENVISLLPGTAIDSLTIAHLVDSPTYTEPTVGAGIAAAWLVAILGAAYVSLLRRDA